MAAVAVPETPPRAFDFRSPVRACGDPLDEVIATSRARIVRWRKDHAQAGQWEAQRAIQDLNRERQYLDDLKADLSNIGDLTEAAARMRAEGLQLGEAVRESLAATARRAEAAQRTKQQLQELLELRQQELRHEEEALEDRRQTAGAQSAEIDSLLAMYRNRLGLSITRAAPQTVRFAFTLLDEADPSREFSVTVGVNDLQGATYRVLDCRPQLPGLQALAQRLNAEPRSALALPRFVCAVRRAFQEVASASKAP